MKILLIISYNFGIIVGKSRLQTFVFDSLKELETFLEHLSKKDHFNITFIKVVEGTPHHVHRTEIVG